MHKLRITCLLLSSLILFSCSSKYNNVMLRDDFSMLDTGLFSVPVGAHTEYHYLPEAGEKGNWTVSSFASGGGWGTAWQVKQDNEGKLLCQTYRNRSNRSTHPMVVAGDSLWRNYKVKVRFSASDPGQYSGIAFRYRNDRCFYFFGVKDSLAYISVFRHALSWDSLNETVIARTPYSSKPGTWLTAIITVEDSLITAQLEGSGKIKAVDNTYNSGKIGLVSNSRAKYSYVEVLGREEEISRIETFRAYYEQESGKLREGNPGMVVWKKLNTSGFGVGRNLRFGDLDNDGKKDVLVGQVVHHNWPRDSHSELSCLTAMTFDGEVLWQTGKPDPENNHLTNDVGFQIHDIDNDGNNEVVYCMNFEIIIADAASGRTKLRIKTPLSKIENDKFPRILGDCIFFFDCEGKGWDSDILIKDRYTHFWVMNNRLQILWSGDCKTGHYPYASDVDHDGRDELTIGYSLYDHDGRQLWCLDNQIDDHADGVAVVNFTEEKEADPVIMYTASNAGYARTDLDGNIMEHLFIGHVQNPAVANFRSDLPGLETVTINFWGNQGIIHFYDASGKVYYDFEPSQYGSMCLPLNWNGTGEEYFVHNPSIKAGGVFDGWGRKVLQFPDDGHPEMCNAVLDLTGDCRDEIVVWDPDEIWIYTQEDNPREGRLYKPVRNPLYNYSNYQATVSLPGWNL